MSDVYGNGRLGLYDPALHIFVDSSEVRSLSNVCKKWGRLAKHHEPVLQPEYPHEGHRTQVGSVIFDQETSKFRCWYLSLHEDGPVNQKGLICYAESSNGIDWEKPELGLYEWQGSKKNNICLTPKGMEPLDLNLGTVIRDENDPDPENRYKYVAFMQDERMYAQPELWAIDHYLFTSPDGIHWKIPGRNINAGSCSDRFWLSWDQRRNRWLAAMGPASGDGYIRMIALKESPDLENWSDFIVPFKPDEREEFGNRYDHHTLYPFLYGNQYLGYFDRYEQSSFILHNELVSSRDAIHWERPNRDIEFNQVGPDGSFDDWWILFSSNPPIPVGDKLYFYYQAGRLRNTPPVSQMTLGLGTLRRDGFAGLMNFSKRAVGARVLTEPVEVLGNELYVNAEVFAGGQVKVGLLTRDYEHIDGFRPTECKPITESGIRVKIGWNSRTNLERLRGEKIALELEFSRAMLYSYRFGQAVFD